MTLRIIDCKATPNSIKVFFSDALNVVSDSHSASFASSAANVQNYDVGGKNSSGAPIPVDLKPDITPIRGGHAIVLTPNNSLPSGSAIIVTVKNIKNESGSDGLPTPPPGSNVHVPQDFSVATVNGEDNEEKDIRRIARVAEDSFAFPQLSEEIGFAPSPLARPSGGPSGGGTASLGQVITQAVSDVLGWKIKPDDSKGFVGALNASFTCTDVDGHTECKWMPRTYAVQTDLSGGITGAQASLYSRAQDALNQSLPLLDGLYPLDPEADAEDVAALKGIARSQLTELVNELGVAGGPRVARVNQYFQLLLQDPGTQFPPTPISSFITDPDRIKGTLGSLRDELGLNFQTQDFVNTVQDEQDLSNFRILSDYVTSLAQSWINNLGFFGLKSSKPFFGTQLVLLSRQLSVVAEAVDEVRFTLDSVFIGPAERQTLKLVFGPNDEPLFAEDFFNWIQRFATDEGVRLIQDGGKYGVQFSFLPIAQQLQHLVNNAHDPNPFGHAFRTSRVKRAMQHLAEELNELVELATPISHVIEEEPTNTDFDALRQEVALLAEAAKQPTLPAPPVLVSIPPQLTFPQQRVTTESPPQLLTIFNVGGSSVSVNAPTISRIGNNPPEFKIIEPDPFPTLLPPQATLPVSIIFIPADINDRTATLTITYNGISGTTLPLQIKLNGKGVPQRS
jgi:hypothetical protein